MDFCIFLLCNNCLQLGHAFKHSTAQHMPFEQDTE